MRERLLAGLLAMSAALVAMPCADAAAAPAPDLAWSRRDDGGARLGDVGVAILADAGGDVFVAGESHDGLLGADLLVRRLAREDGAPRWTVRIPSGETNDMALTALARDPQGHLVIGGFVRGCPG